MSKTNKKITTTSNMSNNGSLHLEHTADTICFGSLSENDKQQLRKIGILPSCVPDGIYSIDCNSLNRARHGIGMRNVNGGVEFISFEEMKTPTTIHQRGITVICSEEGGWDCCLFVNFIDYLAYLSLLKEEALELPRRCDSIILNHPCNLSHFLAESEDYDIVHLLLPNTPAGKVLARTVMDRSASTVDWSVGYVHYQSLRSVAFCKHLKSQKSLCKL